MYDASKEAYNQQLQGRAHGSSVDSILIVLSIFDTSYLVNSQ